MKFRHFRSVIAATFFVACILAHGGAFADKPAPQSDKAKRFSAAQVAFFEKDVLPILKANCFKCHGGSRVRGGLRLNSRETILKGGDTGPAISLTRPDDSLLLRAIHYKGDLQMPPDGRLPQKDVDTLTRWVKEGLPWTPGTVDVRRPDEKGVVTEEAKNYWAYRPVKRPAVPAVKDAAWVRTAVDAFLLAKLEAKGLTPSPPADRVALVRRVTFDLTGLPPTPQEVDAFVKDDAPDAYERLVDRLLASPQYGEKWARHWLDLVRYAETNGYERDGPKPFAWRFRDYVIRSFNADKPYDRFVKEQLAGDEIDRDNPDAIIATGYYRLGLWDDEPVDAEQARFDEFDDVVATTAQVFLAMTMNCARCHDHKIDPIPQKDYYRLVAFFRDIQPFSDTRGTSSRFNLTDLVAGRKRADEEREQKRRDARIAELRAAQTRIEDKVIRKLSAEDQRAAEGDDRPRIVRKVQRLFTPEQKDEYDRVRFELDQLRRKVPAGRELALSVNNCLVHPPATHVLVRGNVHAPGARVEPGFPAVLGGSTPVLAPPVKNARSSGRRRVLADWIASPDNRLTARVLVNRLWQHHFGKGLVASSNDFGKFGTLPTHPELLDWLAGEFVRGGWQIKRMHKLLLLSSAYRMSSRASPAGLKVDPGNTLLWRFSMRRLTAEEVRDAMLAISGRLNPKMGGPSIYPPIPREVLAGQSRPGEGWPVSLPDEAARRSIYVHVKRSLLVPILSHHDQADTDSSCPVRYTTTVPTQALGMLNGEFANEQAEAFAGRLRRTAPDTLDEQVRQAVRLTTGRSPSKDEVRKDAAFVRSLREKHLDETAALKQYCLMLLNTNEFIYLD
ncbi:MAG: PSD1 domain-containing protein [Planctomycetes bacterium]|nr:PSD1 domain-containing protein [Planctomycetota bacterium]